MTCLSQFSKLKHIAQYTGNTMAVYTLMILLILSQDFPGGSDSKESACNARDLGSIPQSRRAPGEGNGYPLLYSCLENPMDRGAWWARVHEVTESWTRLKGLSMHTCTLPNITALVPLDQSQP